MKTKFWIVSKYEFLQSIKKASFWITTLFFPFFIFIIGYLSSYSARSSIENATKVLDKKDSVYILDQANIIDTKKFKDQYTFIEDKNTGIRAIENNETKLFIYYPSNLLSSHQIEVYLNSESIFQDESFKSIGQNILKQSIISTIAETQYQELYYSNINYNLTRYKDGELISDGYQKVILAGLGVMLYFFMMIFGNRFMLISMSEEKENRLMEVMLTCIRSKDLILGKIVGNFMLIFLQLIFIVIVPYIVMKFVFPDILSIIQINASLFDLKFIAITLFYVITGFLFFLALIVGVGAATPNAKEASGLSAPFIILAILPIYLSSMIIANPSGSLAMFFSYFPFTAPMILLFRNVIGEINTLEFIVSSIVLIIYLIVAFVIAKRIFEIGALQFNKKISLKSIFGK